MRIVVLGLGYVGLTLALTLADVGLSVIGVDKSGRRIKQLNKLNVPIYEPQIKEVLERTIKAGRIQFLERIPALDASVAYVIAVGTPADGTTREPLLQNYKNAAIQISERLKRGDLVIQRSTVPVRTARTILKKILEENSNLKASTDFYLSCAPERTLQGNALKELRELTQIVGGIDEASTEKTVKIFKRMTDEIIRMSSLDAAELVKLIDNTYRDITISIGNTYGKICDSLGLDAREIIEAANYRYARNNILLPGAGVGGGCVGKDAYLLMSSMSEHVNLDLIKTAREINDSMVGDTIALISNAFEKAGSKIRGSKILILGFAFKGDPPTDDIRFSPTLHIVDFLRDRQAEIFGHDAIVSRDEIESLGIRHVSDIYSDVYDCVILMNSSSSYKEIDFQRLGRGGSPLVIDGWYMYDVKALQNLGVRYFALGAKNE